MPFSVDVSEMLDKVVVTKKTEAPVDKRKEVKDSKDNLSFCNELNGIKGFKLMKFLPIILNIFTV